MTGEPIHINAVTTTDALAQLQAQARQVYCDPSLVNYAVKLVTATRNPAPMQLDELAPYIQFGASPRATISLIEGARALALLRGRAYVWPEDIGDLVHDVLRHRLSLTYEALAAGVDANHIIDRIVAKISRPARPLEHRVVESRGEARIAAQS